jgi:predicted peptidase
MRRVRARALMAVAVVVLATASPSRSLAAAATGLTDHELTDASGNGRLRFLVYLPETYGKEPARRWPLLLYLHGAGQRGTDLTIVRRGVLPRMLADRRDFPFVVLAPQCAGEYWDLRLLVSLVELGKKQYAIDPDRVYATGYSMGGYGSFDLATARPDLFAAIVPICGGGDASRACALKAIPVRAFHNRDDPIVSVYESRRMVDAVKACGGDATLTIYPVPGHDAWTATYSDPSLFEWLLKQKRK